MQKRVVCLLSEHRLVGCLWQAPQHNSAAAADRVPFAGAALPRLVQRGVLLRRSWNRKARGRLSGKRWADRNMGRQRIVLAHAMSMISPQSGDIPFAAFREQLDSLILATANKLEREFPKQP